MPAHRSCPKVVRIMRLYRLPRVPCLVLVMSFRKGQSLAEFTDCSAGGCNRGPERPSSQARSGRRLGDPEPISEAPPHGSQLPANFPWRSQFSPQEVESVPEIDNIAERRSWRLQVTEEGRPVASLDAHQIPGGGPQPADTGVTTRLWLEGFGCRIVICCRLAPPRVLILPRVDAIASKATRSWVRAAARIFSSRRTFLGPRFPLGCTQRTAAPNKKA